MTSNFAPSGGPALEPPMDDRLLLDELGTDVAIVGAGPAGAALAYILASRGVRTVLVERHESFAREFRGEGLQPAGLQCIDQMELQAAFALVPQTSLRQFRFCDGRRSALVPAPVGTNRNPVMVSQPGLLEMLTGEADVFPNFRLLRGVAVTGLLRDDGRVVGFETSGYPPEIRARLTIGCDGRGSIVRRETTLKIASQQQEFDVLWLRAELPDFLPDRTTGHLDFASQHAILVYPSPDGNEQVGAVLPKGTLKGMAQEERLDWIIERSSPKLATALETARLSMRGPVALNVACNRLDRWSEPGVLLIGDAAHTMSPVGGYGINMALRDSLVAANHLVPVMQRQGTSEEIDVAAAAVAEERLPEIARVQQMQTREAPRLLQPNRALLRLAPLIARMPALLQLMSRRRARLRRSLEDIELVV